MDFKKYWHAFLHWPGWKSLAGGCAAVWKKVSRWPGWRRLFLLPLWLVLVLCILCGAGLVWVFALGLEQQWIAYLLYPISAYSLVAVCAKIPTLGKQTAAWLQRHPRTARFLADKETQFKLGLYFEQFLNFAYGIFKIISGVVIGSAWIGCDGIYNLAQAVIQLFQILRRKNPGNLRQQWHSYRICGVLVLLMHLSLSGIVFQMVNWNRAKEYGTVMIFATAAFAFFKLITSFIAIAKDRKHTHPIDSSVRMLKLSQAMFAMFSLQASLLHAFGTGESWEHWMNMATGCAVCLLIVALGIYMIRRGNREIKKITGGSP